MKWRTAKEKISDSEQMDTLLTEMAMKLDIEEIAWSKGDLDLEALVDDLKRAVLLRRRIKDLDKIDITRTPHELANQISATQTRQESDTMQLLERLGKKSCSPWGSLRSAC